MTNYTTTSIQSKPRWQIIAKAQRTLHLCVRHPRPFHSLSPLEISSIAKSFVAITCRAIETATERKVEHQLQDAIAAIVLYAPQFLSPSGMGITQTLARLTDYSFINRRLRKLANVMRANHSASSRMVGGHRKYNYCDEATMRFIEKCDELNDSILKRKNMINTKTSQILNLYEVAQKRHSRRFNENYHIIKNLELIASEQQWHCYFITLTAPANYHPNPIYGRCSYNQKELRSSHEFLAKNWAKTRAMLAKNKYSLPFSTETLYGIRTAELHKDGCTHWHAIIFCNPENFTKFERVLNSYFNPENDKSRVTIKEITMGESGKDASPSTYLFKYIAKTVDASGLSESQKKSLGDTSGGDKQASETDKSTIGESKRVQNGLRSIGIRQLQLFGTDRLISLYRILNNIDDDFVASISARNCGATLELLSDCRRNPKGLRNLLIKHSHKINKIYGDKLNKYGEPVKKVVGIKFIVDDIDYIFDANYVVPQLYFDFIEAARAYEEERADNLEMIERHNLEIEKSERDFHMLSSWRSFDDSMDSLFAAA